MILLHRAILSVARKTISKITNCMNIKKQQIIVTDKHLIDEKIFNLSIFIFLFLTNMCTVGCASFGSPQTESIVDRLETGKLTILASCEFYNSVGQVIRKYPGDICVPIENGDLYISDTIHLTKLDKYNRIIWSKLEPVHHQMKRSFNKRDLFFISGYYETRDAIPIRQDMIKVIDSSGSILRQFDFSNYLKSQDPKYIEKYKYKNTWSFNGSDQTFFE